MSDHSPQTAATPAPTRTTRRAARFAARDFLRAPVPGGNLSGAVSTLHRVRECGFTPTGGQVAVRLSGVPGSSGAVAGFSGVATCGSTWACPVCAVKISARRVSEMERAITHHQNAGGDVAMLTLTMRHRAGQSLADLWSALTAAWRTTTHGKTWRNDKSEFGVIGYCRAVEVTHGKHGWHVHVHAVLFLARQLSPEMLRALGVRMFDRWAMKLKKENLAAPLRDRGGLDIRHAYNTSDGHSSSGSGLADYVSKYGDEVDQALAERDQHRRHQADRAHALSLEVAAGDLKVARKQNRTPWQILADAMDGDAGALELWREWERASKGRRRWTWTRATEDTPKWAAVLAARGEELTDEQIAAEEADGGIIATITNDEWRVVRGNHGLAVQILNAAETGGFPAICSVVADYGINPRPPEVSRHAA